MSTLVKEEDGFLECKRPLEAGICGARWKERLLSSEEYGIMVENCSEEIEYEGRYEELY